MPAVADSVQQKHELQPDIGAFLHEMNEVPLMTICALIHGPAQHVIQVLLSRCALAGIDPPVKGVHIQIIPGSVIDIKRVPGVFPAGVKIRPYTLHVSRKVFLLGFLSESVT